MQTEWYKSVQNTYGVLLDTRHTYTKSDWQIFSAGIMTDTTVRDMFISSDRGMSSQPLTDWYDAASGMPETFRARLVVGGHPTVLQSPILTQPTLHRLHFHPT
ncbi:hypothetical protein C8R41DRAFT_900755 [Lentinula lateritia]|uniref:Glutaminase A central domain-containing protein n=1 Tax=Lentinula lateritia TaxID=40482 RepID=A0ABQ8VQF1_9AGAR|nr:hypothetical protein C8R41DRAFT_900755 [Lentinula lateritia]